MPILLDNWQDFRTPEYHNFLAATAWMMIEILRAHVSPPDGLDADALMEAYERANHSLPKLPMEWDGDESRLENSRWRHGAIPVGTDTDDHYCEHPWSKSETLLLLRKHAGPALRRGASSLDMLAHVSVIVDMRQDTVLLPHGGLEKLFILHESKADGLLGRYGDGVRDQNIQLIDRMDGAVLNYERIRTIEVAMQERVDQACQALDAL